MLATSDPQPGSETPSAAIFSPASAGARKVRFCSSVPISLMIGVAIWLCTISAMFTPALCERDELLAEHGHVPVVEAAAAVLRVVVDAEEAELAALLEDLAREDALPVPLERVRLELLLDEGPAGLAEGVVLRR